ncbi:asparagine synthase (glutamine-hydrolyzing) [Shinella sumterensis]|uniref:asparagine synthase (glutamine-hydrolyzing) n=1 Tax=Shinella sumterensis TaxID=1967501 RepID=UPI00106E11C4|nr:asparagine synthase (glutamine-hydrolyzing) [Shinella sumterensis]MCD1266820.1 asparagine synthase (glutamine-hydrolyzing) [Shinella sumterensis]TFE95319.1 asparagine synthase (glutamine-hydrolyzing) [Shinella sumterensis]
MCGIAGIIRFDGGPIASELAAMSELIAHRGPDQASIWSTEGHGHTVGLAHRRLSIRDLSENGRQPLASHSGRSMLVYNGELYNETALIHDLQKASDFQMRSRCDSEVLLAAVEQFGPSYIDRFNGIFAFALYDRETGETILARDPIGIKPLYIWKSQSGSAIAFASEVKAFLGIPAFGRAIDTVSLSTFLTQGYVGPNRSLMQDVTSLAPGQVLRISPAGQISNIGNLAPRWFSDSIHAFDPDELKAQFEAAVMRQRVSDVPLAVWQSGGIDSSLVNAACSTPRPRSLIFASDVGDFDESSDASLVATHLKSEAVVASFHDDEEPAETFSSVVWHMDGELADSSALAVKKLSAATKPHATVVLSGDGADELFGGYATYGATRLASRLAAFTPQAPSQWMARQLLAKNNTASMRYPAMELAGRFLQGLPLGPHAHAEWRRYGMPWDLRDIASSEMRDVIDDGARAYYAAIDTGRGRSSSADPASWGQDADLSYYLPGDMLMKVDRMSMAHGLEVRVPFLDIEFIKYTSHIAGSLRLPNGKRTKPVLRDLAVSYALPAAITERQKTGFNVPLAHRLRTDYRSVITDLLVREDYVSPYLNPNAVRRLVSEHLSGKTNRAYLLWTLMTFAQWRRHLER